MHVSFRTIAVAVLGLALAAGCGTPIHRNQQIDVKYYPAKPAQPPESIYKSEGSLWPGEERYKFLFAHKRASQVNDTLTVYVVESANAKKEATTETERETTIDADLTALMGVETSFKNRNSKFDPTKAVSVGTKSKFKGDGDTSRKETLNATLTAIVTQVLPNGNMVVEGRKTVVVNNEEQFIFLQGIVDPLDISVSNTISSERIANARIEYYGVGQISDQQRPGWGAKVLDYVWPF